MATMEHTAYEAPRELKRESLGAYARNAPATFVYLFVLLVTTWLLATVRPSTADRLLLDSSTNLHQLARDPVHVLVASAFWVGGWSSLALWALLFVLVAAPLERAIGSARAIGVFAAGHVGATLLVALGLWIALRLDAVDRSVVHARDVGASYGFFAVAGLALLLLHGRLRVVGVTPLFAFLAATLVIAPDFTAVGHLVAALIGLACYPLVRSAASRRTR